MDFIRMVLDFIILIQKAKLDYASKEVYSLKNMSCTVQLNIFEMELELEFR
jgi:hypothetical protein